MSDYNYWQECVSESLDEHGVSATVEQIAAIAKDIAGAHEVHGECTYRPEHPAIREAATAKAALVKEREKVFCRECKGEGRIVSFFGSFQSDSQCHKCGGEGKHKP